MSAESFAGLSLSAVMRVSSWAARAAASVGPRFTGSERFLAAVLLLATAQSPCCNEASLYPAAGNRYRSCTGGVNRAPAPALSTGRGGADGKHSTEVRD